MQKEAFPSKAKWALLVFVLLSSQGHYVDTLCTGSFGLLDQGAQDGLMKLLPTNKELSITSGRPRPCIC